MRPILCAVDFSYQSRQALRWAVALASRRHASLRILYAVDPLLAHVAQARLHVSLVDVDARRELQQFATEAVASAASKHRDWHTTIEVGQPAATILRNAAELRPQLVVMGTHGLGGLKKLLLGSTAARVLSRTTTPLLLVPAGEWPEAKDVDPLSAVKRILVATDFEPTAESAIAWATSLAGTLSIPLTIAHVVKPIVVPEQWQPYVVEADETALRHARRKLTELQLPGGSRSQMADTVAALGEPAAEIASVARERHAGLIVMGLANRQNAAAIKPGSVAYGVVRLSHLPVIVVPPRVVRKTRPSARATESSHTDMLSVVV